jgi:hypothetical protein
MDSYGRMADGGLSDVFAAILDQLDENFRAHCTFGGLRSGTLTIQVDDPRWVAPLRSQWLFVLRERFQQHPRGGRVRRIEFRSERKR